MPVKKAFHSSLKKSQILGEVVSNMLKIFQALDELKKLNKLERALFLEEFYLKKLQ